MPAKLLRYVCVGLAIIIGLATGIWYVRGGRILSVQTGSMVPTFAPGDGVIVAKTTATRLQVGDVVAYRSAANPSVIISHRITVVLSGHRFVTQGDYLTQADQPINAQQIIGRVTGVLPSWGRVVTILRTPLGLLVAVYLPICALVFMELWRFQNRNRSVVYRLYAR